MIIELECPTCHAPLEVDAGFAGGVCRCSSCGSLMTVPADPSSEEPEQLARPDAPERTGRANVPGGQAGDDVGLSAAALAAAASTGVERYTTESGKTVEVSRRQRIPTAQKRKIVRRATYAVIALIFLVLIAVGGIAGYLLVNTVTENNTIEAPPPPIIIDDEKVLVFDPVANPFMIQQPNVMGIPVAESSVAIIDASDPEADWVELVARMIAAGGRRMKDGQKFQVMFVTASGLDSVPTTMNWDFKSAGKVIERAEKLSEVGPIDLPDAISKALKQGARQVTVIASRPNVDAEKAEAITKAIQDANGVQFNIFIIDDEQTKLFETAEASKGFGLMLTTGRIKTWKRNVDELGVTGDE